jgi:hypothetical protein
MDPSASVYKQNSNLNLEGGMQKTAYSSMSLRLKKLRKKAACPSTSLFKVEASIPTAMRTTTEQTSSKLATITWS